MSEAPVPSTLSMYRSLALSVYLPSFLMSMCQGSVLLLIPLFALDLGASAGLASFAFALRGLGNMTMDVPAGFSVARLGDKTTMVLGIGIMGFVALLASQCTDPLEVAAAAFLFGAGMATWMLSRLAHISDAVHVTQRGKAIATMAGIQRFGNMLGPFTSSVIADQFGFQYAFLAVAIVAALALAVVITNVTQTPVSHGTAADEHSPNLIALIPFVLRRHHKVFATAGVALLCLTVMRAGRSLLVPLWGKSLGLEVTEIGLIVSLSASVDMLMFVPVGYMMDNWGRKYSALSCILILAAALFFMQFSDSFTTLLLAAMLAGLGNGLGSGINMTLGADFAPAKARGEFLGVWRMVSDFGSFTGPLVMGWIANMFVLATAFSFTAGLGLVGAVIMALFVQETLVKSPRVLPDSHDKARETRDT